MFSTQAVEVKKLKIISFSCYNFKGAATYLDTGMLKKNLSLVQTLIVKCKPILKVPLYIRISMKLRKQYEIY